MEHVHRGLLFIHDRHHLENGGYLCVRDRQCSALGGARNGVDKGVSSVSIFWKLILNVTGVIIKVG